MPQVKWGRAGLEAESLESDILLAFPTAPASVCRLHPFSEVDMLVNLGCGQANS